MSLFLALVLIFAGLVIFTVILPNHSEAAIIYVGGTGPGNQSSFYNAIISASPGDTIYLFSRTYYGSFAYIDKPLTIIGENRDTVILNAGGSRGLEISAPNVRITGLTIKNAGPHWEEAGIKLQGASGCYIEGNNISSNKFAGIFLEGASGCTLRNNVMYDDGIVIYGSQRSQWINYDIDTSNTVNGKPVQYLKGQTGGTVPEGAGQVIIAGSDSMIVENQNITAASIPIIVGHSSGVTIRNNTASNSWAGVYLAYSNRTVMTENKMADDGIFMSGVTQEHWDTHTIDTSNTVNGKPVYYWKDASGGTVPEGAGQVILANSQSIRVENQNLDNGTVGVIVAGSQGIAIANNSASYCNWAGIYLVSSNTNDLTNNKASHNVQYGMFLSLSDSNTLSLNTANSNDVSGIRMDYSSINTVTFNNVSNNGDGMHLLDSNMNAILNNSALDNDNDGFLLLGSDLNTISGNTATYGYHGIDTNYCTQDVIEDNTLSFSWAGINIESSTWFIIRRNVMVEDGIFIEGYSVEEYDTHTIDTSNTVNGKPVRYWQDTDGGTVLPGAGEVILANVTNAIVENQNLENGTVGVLLGFSSGNSIINNTILSDQFGIHLSYSSGNSITDNLVSFNHDTGVYAKLSDSNTINRNEMLQNSREVIHILRGNGGIIADNTISGANWGIHLEVSNLNTIIHNSLSLHSRGIELYSSDNNVVTDNSLTDIRWAVIIELTDSNEISFNRISEGDAGVIGFKAGYDRIMNNTISHNDAEGIILRSSSGIIVTGNEISYNMRGVELNSSSNCAVYHNNFVDNNLQAFDNAWNLWDDGYPSGGNFWSDYGGIDKYNGPNQDIPGSDKIGDTPYNISGAGDKDRYPLWFAVGPLTAPRDLKARGFDARVELTWERPLADGGFAITNYRIYRGVTAGGETFVAEIGDFLNYSDTGLANGTTYFYRVSARNVLGEGPESDEANATPLGPPGPPLNLTAMAGDQRVTLHWEPPAYDGGIPITSYRIFRGTSSGGESYIAGIGNVLTYLDLGRTNGVTYYYQVSAMNKVAEGPRSNEANTTPQGQPPNKPPLCAILDPHDGDTISGTYTIVGNASDPDGTVLWVEVQIDGGQWWRATGTDSWSFVLDTTSIMNGLHTISARAYDGINYSEVSTVTVNVNNGVPNTGLPIYVEWWFLASIAIIVALLSIVIVLFWRKRKREDDETTRARGPPHEKQ